MEILKATERIEETAKITKMTALELGREIRAGRISAVEAAEAALAQIERLDETYNCFITVFREQVLARAREVQEIIETGGYEGFPLAGVPVAVKDNICTHGLRTTCGSRMLENFIPPYDAEAVSRLKAAGMVIIGKVNMDEFAMGSTTETSCFGPTKNPWDPTRAPGGSSGGAAAAVAAGEVPLALGSDTGGSIRQPGAFCGITGLKPTYGTISRYGLIAYGSSLDQIGPMARNVEDCGALLEVLASYDPKDSTSMKRQDYRFTKSMKQGVAGLRIGIPGEYIKEGLDPQVKRAVLAAAKTLAGLGAQVEEFSLDMVKYAVPSYYIIASAEASSNLSRFDGVKYGRRAREYEGLQELYRRSRSEGFGSEVKRRMLIGSFVLSSGYYDAYYNKALKAKALIKESFDRAFQQYDIILGPTAPSTAPRLGESLEDPLKMYLGDIYTVSVNLAGLPAISLPCGFDDNRLPIGLQLIGPAFGEEILLQAAYSYEQAREKSGEEQTRPYQNTGERTRENGQERTDKRERTRENRQESGGEQL